MRLIDADAFDRFLVTDEFNMAMLQADSENRAFKNIPMFYCTDSFRAVMKKRPTIDAVPIVRCKDCVYYNTTGCADGYGWCERPCDGIRSDEWYCADAERREDYDQQRKGY